MKQFNKIIQAWVKYLMVIILFCLLGYVGAHTYSLNYISSDDAGLTTIYFKYADDVDRLPFIEIETSVSPITVEIVSRHGRKKFLYSSAVFSLGNQNKISTRTSAPLTGDYVGFQGSGLFWSRKWYAWNAKIISRYIALDIGKRYIVVSDKNGKLLAKKRARFPRIENYPIQEKMSLGGQSLHYYLPRNQAINNPPVILVSGSNNSSLSWEASYFASKGFPVLTILPNPHLTTKCLYKLNPQNMTPAIKQFLEKLDYEIDKIIMIGISAGGTATLLYKVDQTLPALERFLLSPIPLHLNGATGPKCSFPAQYWEGHEEYINFFNGWKDFVLYKIGIIDQRTAIENVLLENTEAAINEVSLLTNIPPNTYIFLGEDDSVLPTTFTYTEACDSKKGDDTYCILFEGAGHNLLYSGHTAMGCSSHKKNCSENLTATYKAQKRVLTKIFEVASKSND